jgi:outer membrane protein assembly factor BamB
MPRWLLALTLPLTLTLPAFADWTQFRGPNGQGVADPAGVPLNWSKTKNLLWKATVPGRGHSSPIVVKGRVFLESASADGSQRMLLCYDAATGKLNWTKTAPAQSAHTHAKNNLATSTPASDGERVYALFWDGVALGLRAYTLDGKELWQTSLGAYKSEHGAGHSPIVSNGTVFVNFDQDRASQVVAVDAATGEKKWAVERKAHRASYTPPIILNPPGQPAELIVGTTTGIQSYNPATGDVNWSYTINWPTAKKLRAIGVPILVDGKLVLYTGEGGDGRYMVALTPGGKGDVTATAKAWDRRQDTPYVPGILAYKGHLYWVTDKGFAVCADPKTGKILWNERAFTNLPRGSYVMASPILLGDKVLAIAESGKALVFKASPKGYEEVAANDLGEPVTASPAVSDGKLFLRGRQHLFCFGKK